MKTTEEIKREIENEIKMLDSAYKLKLLTTDQFCTKYNQLAKKLKSYHN